MNKEVNDCKPQIIEHFIGNKLAVERCKVALSSAWNEGTKFPHTLMQGGAGLGKTELSHLLAKEMGCELHEQLAQNISKPADIHALLLTPQDREVVLIDEIHELPSIAQTTLYRAMEDRHIFLETRKGKKSRPVEIANFTIIGATTDPQKLLQPLTPMYIFIYPPKGHTAFILSFEPNPPPQYATKKQKIHLECEIIFFNV